MNEQQLAKEAVEIQNACNFGALCRIFAMRVLENQNVLNDSKNPVIRAWLDKLSSLIPGLQFDLSIAKTELPTTAMEMPSLRELAKKMQARLAQLEYRLLLQDAQLIALIVEMIGLAGGSIAVSSLQTHNQCDALAKGEGEGEQ